MQCLPQEPGQNFYCSINYRNGPAQLFSAAFLLLARRILSGSREKRCFCTCYLAETSNTSSTGGKGLSVAKCPTHLLGRLLMMLQAPCVSERLVKGSFILGLFWCLFVCLFLCQTLWSGIEKYGRKNKLIEGKLNWACKIGAVQLLQVLFHPCWKGLCSGSKHACGVALVQVAQGLIDLHLSSPGFSARCTKWIWEALYMCRINLCSSCFTAFSTQGNQIKDTLCAFSLTPPPRHCNRCIFVETHACHSDYCEANTIKFFFSLF